MRFCAFALRSDIREVVPIVRARYPAAPLFAIGWSLGANILVNYLGEEGAAAAAAGGGAAAAASGSSHGFGVGLDGAASMCNPFDLVTCDEALEHGMVRQETLRDMCLTRLLACLTTC
jgi:predicted alpha/beta-fold hydrolase